MGLSSKQATDFYQDNQEFFQRIIPVYYLNCLFNRGCIHYRNYVDDEFSMKLSLSNSRGVELFIWRQVLDKRYDYDSTFFLKIISIVRTF